MKRIKAVKFVTSLLVVAFLFCSCSVTQGISLNKDNSGQGETVFEASEFFVTVLEDLTSWKEGSLKEEILDVAVATVWESLEKSSVASDVLFEKSKDNSYVGTFYFEDFSTLVDDLCENYPNQKLLTITEKEDKTRLELNINLETYDVLSKVVPILDDENFKVWGPVYNNPPYDEISEQDYKDMVSWMLGSDGPEAIDNSVISFKFTLPNEVSETNGKIVNSNQVEFTFPLIDFLLLHSPIEFYCEY